MNPWERITSSGGNQFARLSCPKILGKKVDVEDLELKLWYPNQDIDDELFIHQMLSPEYYLAGEWFKSSALRAILKWSKNQQWIEKGSIFTKDMGYRSINGYAEDIKFSISLSLNKQLLSNYLDQHLQSEQTL